MRLSSSRGLLLAAVAVLAIGCWPTKKVDPGTRQAHPPLEVPPDLTRPDNGADLSAPVADGNTHPAVPGKAAPAEVPPVLPLAKAQLDADHAVLTVLDDLEHAWRTVGLALDPAGFMVEDRDREKGLYYVRFNGAPAGKDQRSVFSRWFGRKAPPAGPRYQLRLERDGDQTAVRVHDASGAAMSGEVAQRLLDALYQQLK